MKCFIFAFVVLNLAAYIGACQIGSATEAVAEELVEAMLRQGGRDTAVELAELGGEQSVRNVLERAASEGGDELVERVAQYGTRYGPAGLKAVELSPSRIIRALDAMPPELVRPAIRAAARDPELTSGLVARYGKDALEVVAKHPGVGASLVEKLGADGITVGAKLTTDQAVTFARYADDIAKLPSVERSRVLDAMIKAPAALLDYLETHPKVLITAGGVAAIIAAKDNIFGVVVPPAIHDSPQSGLIERLIFGLGDKLGRPATSFIAILLIGVFCRVAVGVRSAWKLKALRFQHEQARFATELATGTPPTSSLVLANRRSRCLAHSSGRQAGK